MLPTLGLIAQVTAVSALPVTVAVNCCVWLAVSVALGGDTDTVGAGKSVTFAVPDCVGSATLVAMTVTLCWLLTVPGAVLRPVLDTPPTLGLTDHVTAVLAVPFTAAANCAVWFGKRSAPAGRTWTVTWASATSEAAPNSTAAINHLDINDIRLPPA
jgi:hypothetical protein